jgi:DNA integrity scanning protein DisA with diadenylate cyclase activity
MKKVYRKDWSCKLNWQFLMSIHILYHQTLFEVNVFYPCHSNKTIQQNMSYATFIVHFIFTMHVYQVFFHVHHNFTVFTAVKKKQTNKKTKNVEIKPKQYFLKYSGTRENCFRYLKLMSPLNKWYYLKNNYLTLRSKSNEGHYGTRHTALWSCTHIPNIIDLSRKTKKLWSG